MNQLELWIDQNLGKEVGRLGLDRIAPLIRPYYLALKKKGTRFVTIAGTNGKGQTAYTLAHLLKQQGSSYTLWTSPHILSVTERFESSTGPINEDQLFQNCLDDSTHAKILSYFEFLFLQFMRFSLQRSPHIVILEVGLGGRLDAVNALDPDLTCITSIARDHEEILGNKLHLILEEKLGISRPKVPLITAFALNYLQDLTQNWVVPREIPWIDLKKLGVIEKNDHFFAHNQLLAMALLSLLQDQTNLGFLGLRDNWKNLTFPPMPHRGDELGFREGKLHFIGSHNLDGVRKLIDYLKVERQSGFDYVLFACSKRNKREIEAMMKALWDEENLFPEVLFTKFSHPKAWDGKFSELSLDTKKIKEVSWEDFLTKSDLKEKNILVTGSYYFVAAIKSFLTHYY